MIETLATPATQSLARLIANSDHGASASTHAISVSQNHERQIRSAGANDVAHSGSELNCPNRVTTFGRANSGSVPGSAAICNSGFAALLGSGEIADVYARTIANGANGISLAISNAGFGSIVRDSAIPGDNQSATVLHTPSPIVMDLAFGGNTHLAGDHISVVNRLEPQWIVTLSRAEVTTGTTELSNATNPAGNQPDRRQWSRQTRVFLLAQHDPIVLAPNLANLMLPILAGVSCFLANILARGPPRGPPRSQIIDAGRGKSRSCSSQLYRLRFSISPRGPSLVVRFAKPVTLSASGPRRTFRTSKLCCSNTC